MIGKFDRAYVGNIHSRYSEGYVVHAGGHKALLLPVTTLWILSPWL
jgi:hypothetical protein